MTEGGYRVFRNEWKHAVAIIPAEKMDTPRGLWTAICNHSDHDGDGTWQSGPGNAGGVAVALEQHWKAKHGG